MPIKIPTVLKTSILYGLVSALLAVMLSACSDVPKRWDPQAYSVKKGDTLYSIAWRYEKDYRQIALWNGIHPPFAIFPGQRLVMQPVNQDGTVLLEERPRVLIDTNMQQLVVVGETETLSKPEPIKVKLSHVQVQKNDTLYSIARREGFTHHQIARWNHLKAPYLLKPGQKLRLSPSMNAMGQTAQQNNQTVVKPLVLSAVQAKPLTSTVSKTTAQATERSTSNNDLPTRVDKWHWPVKGRVVKRYKANDTSRKGIVVGWALRPRGIHARLRRCVAKYPETILKAVVPE